MPANAEAYEELLKSEIFTGIQNRQIVGYRGIHLFRRNLGTEVEFTAFKWSDSIEAVRTFAGEDYEMSVSAMTENLPWPTIPGVVRVD